MADSVDTQAGKPADPAKPRSPWLRFAPLVLIVLAAAALLASGAHRHLTLENLLASRQSLLRLVEAHRFPAIGAYMLIYIAAVALSLPGALLLTISGGFLFGGWIGGAAAVLAATAGAVLIFLAARSSIGDALARRAGPWLAKFREGFEADAASYLLFLRLAPVFPFWLVNLAPALLGVPLKTFAWTTLIGILPGTFAYAFAGAGLDSIVAAQQHSYAACAASGAAACSADIGFSQLVTRELVYAFAALGIAALIPAGLRRWRARRGEADAP